jgi:hypothetical protein
MKDKSQQNTIAEAEGRGLSEPLSIRSMVSIRASLVSGVVLCSAVFSYLFKERQLLTSVESFGEFAFILTISGDRHRYLPCHINLLR